MKKSLLPLVIILVTWISQVYPFSELYRLLSMQHSNTDSNLLRASSSHIQTKKCNSMKMVVSQASISEPPRTFMDCVRQAAKSCKQALADGHKLIEVEFPPLPLEYLEDSSSSARSISDANTRWAVEFARSFSGQGLVSIIYPDKPELDDAVQYVDMEGGATPYPNVTLSTVRSDSIASANSIDQIVTSIFSGRRSGSDNVKPIADTKLYIALIFSTQELPDLEKLQSLTPSVPIVFFNLKLDQLVRCKPSLISLGLS
jgi:hypothetical protein